jgi:hypothetical protein
MSSPDDATPEPEVGSDPDPLPAGPTERQRIGNAEREAAVSALKQHHAAGRINALEYEERSPLPTTDPSGSAPDHVKRGPLLPEPWGTTVMSLSPLVAIILFFVTHQWLWFLLIPIMGILIYGPEGSPDSHQNNNQHNRNRNRRPDRD